LGEERRRATRARPEEVAHIDDDHGDRFVLRMGRITRESQGNT